MQVLLYSGRKTVVVVVVCCDILQRQFIQCMYSD